MRSARADIFVPKGLQNYTPREVLHSMEARVGPRRARTKGSWVHDLCASKKVVLLCPMCDSPRKFDPKRLGYLREKDWPVVAGKCDGCGVLDFKCAAFFWEETYFLARSTADERRGLARSRLKRLKKGRL